MIKKNYNFPSKEEVLSYLKGQPTAPSKKEIYDHFHIKGGAKKIKMKALLKTLSDENLYQRPHKKESLPPLAKDIPSTLVGRLAVQEKKFVLLPTNRRFKQAFLVEEADYLKEADVGKVYKAKIISLDPPRASLIELLGDLDKISMISAQMADLPLTFPKAVLAATEDMKVPLVGSREDLRKTPLVTIDGVDSRDFDDAVWAEPDSDPKNKGGWHLIVAIADVAHYAKSGSVIDKEALNRGTSAYFPDMVIPMLPEGLSNDLCSLRPNEDRACLGVHLYVDAHGKKKNHRFFRGLMRSSARLTYEEVQKMKDGGSSEKVDPSLIENLYGAFQALAQQREKRGTLEIEIDEPRIILDDAGKIKEIAIKPRLDSHKLIEEFMVLANVAAAEFLEEHEVPTLFRVHEKPDTEKVMELQRTLKTLKIAWKDRLETPGDFTKLLRFGVDSPHKKIINDLVLRCQSQAIYTPDNKGHFGLHLSHYCHFTSPIRRYPDLLVHRGILSVLKEQDALTAEEREDIGFLGNDTSTKERRAESAERDAVDRFMTEYLSERVGEYFNVYVSGVNKAGLFVSILNVGASGLIPMNRLGQDYFIFKEQPNRLEGRWTKKQFSLGDTLKVKLIEADQMKGRLTFELEEGRRPSSPSNRVSPGQKRRKRPRR